MVRDINLFIADHSELFASDVRSFLGRMPGIRIVGFEQNGERAVAFIQEHHPDAVLLELVLDGLDGISVLKALRK